MSIAAVEPLLDEATLADSDSSSGSAYDRVVVTALDPLTLGAAAEAGNLARTHRFVPGSVLRGALASRWIRDNGPPTSNGRREAFVSIFERDVRFGPLYIEGTDVVPLSVQRCRYQPQEECAAPIAYDEAVEPATENTCPVCQGRLEREKGEIAPPVGPVTVTRNGPDSGGARLEEQLFGRRGAPTRNQVLRLRIRSPRLARRAIGIGPVVGWSAHHHRPGAASTSTPSNRRLRTLVRTGRWSSDVVPR